SPDATIVVGTSIDMEMSDELRVTVVAAGLDGNHKAKTAAREPARRSAAESSSDYRKLQQPTVMRQQATARSEAPEANAKPRSEKRRSTEADDYLDIPAFLRRQAD
ncbi:MAG: cell division protein FtsZ, partial [Halomonas sp.]